MPFVQMENISHFLRACQMPPLSLPPHDVFLTVDLYERKDPAQVLQCLGAFSRRASATQPSKFPRSIGGSKSKGGVLSPQGTGSSYEYGSRARGVSNVSQTSSMTFNPVAGQPSSGRLSPTKTGPRSPASPPTTSSWSKKADESKTAPAWNIHQYGYMGGASQGNQGISFGGRRQITTPGPAVPSLADKERRRREAEAEEEQQRQEEELRRQKGREEEEQRAKADEERRWAEETERSREKERREMEEEKIRWAEEQRRWEEDEQRRLKDEKAAEEKLEKERQRKRANSDARLNGQFLSQYQASQSPAVEEPPVESQRIKDLERQLELAKERERQYEREREDLRAKEAARKAKSRSRSRSRPRPVQPSYDLSSQEEERKLLRSDWQHQQTIASVAEQEDTPPPPPPRPLPEPTVAAPSLRPLPDPNAYSTAPNRGRENRADRFLASNPAPSQAQPIAHRAQDYTTTAEVDAENNRRVAAQQKTRAGGWASKSLLEREMEHERERQREWEDSQKQTVEAAKSGVGAGLGTAPGQGAWDVHQYGFMGGDNQNRGGTGLGIGGARRQIIGPRPPP
jgi:hypothetical protein